MQAYQPVWPSCRNSVRVLLVIGTRPEAIKMAPIIRECHRRSNEIEPIICFTGQHREMLSQVAEYFDIQPDIDLDLMRPNQTLSQLTSHCLKGIDETIRRVSPDYVVAEGDTTTVMAASMVAFYQQTSFVHIEAGLRTHNLSSPWPEEFNRRVAGLIANLHCAPTKRAAENLLSEGVDPQHIRVTGNTVIDALLWTVEQERQRHNFWQDRYPMLGDHRVVLITGHRRENFGEKFESVCRAIARLADSFDETKFIYPVHLNPNVREPVYRLLGNRENVHLVEPATYPAFVWLMDRADLIITDSGGVQEEAPSLRTPVLVTRDTTERPEAVEAGAAELVGADEHSIVQVARELLTDADKYALRQIDQNPYGDGHAAERIMQWLLDRAVSSAAA